MSQSLVGCLLFAVLSCGETPTKTVDTVDASSQSDAQRVDAQGNADASVTDARPGVCDAEKIVTARDNRPLQVGDFCDDIQLCAKDSVAVLAIADINVGFACEGQAGTQGCLPSEFYCIRNVAGLVDSQTYERLCEITSLQSPATELITCMVYE